MKKLLFVLFAMALTAGTFAQDRIAVGLKTGFNSTKIKLSDIPSGEDIKTEAKSGFLIGAYGRLRLLGNLSFQPEMYYAKKTSKFSYMGQSFDNTYHTWDIPLLAHLQVADLKVARVYGVAGPVASIIANSKSDMPELEEIKNSNWTFQAGGGVEFGRLSLDVRYEWGLKDITDLKDADLGQKTDVLTVSLGFKLIGL
ncbi:PorT family protein [Marinilabiliaceae bacterium JC017]|nr:PorT family protein [Marinilabiliaceae bacterium JC017]